ncbi:hypothetical protein BDF20DRAFT_839992 [Mycotypha africana]|uniref:uncharacterized protein n=1 Tax=Mycotypha africana TaxID=64632 RepID=UPI0023012AF0|nr:uncharacterized protein BDF20DRAFT_839992 [Mycotypha africana]KAI8967783.1 hypothetical protein BDF20DRAFT_839992 [Mycotypha africana]
MLSGGVKLLDLVKVHIILEELGRLKVRVKWRSRFMFNGLQSEQDTWSNCVKIVLGLLEDSLLKDVVLPKSVQMTPDLANKRSLSTDSLSNPNSPGGSAGVGGSSLQSIKRKRSFNESADRKLKRVSDNLVNDMARNLTVGGNGNTHANAQGASISMMNPQQRNPVPALHQLSGAGGAMPSHPLLQPPSSSAASSSIPTNLEDWMKLQAQRFRMPLEVFAQLFESKQKLLRIQLDRLQQPNQTFDQLNQSLNMVIRSAKDLSGDGSLPFGKIFPEWALYENKISKLAIYVQSMIDMNYSITQTIPQSNDLLHDIQELQKMMENKMSLYGDALIQNGLEWKSLGFPVDDALLNANKEWIYHVCTGLLDALDGECKKLQNIANDVKQIVNTAEGEKLMQMILNGMEFIADATTLIGFSTQKLIYQCRMFCTIYCQWTSESLDLVSHPAAHSHRKVEFHYLQLLENVTRILSYLYKISVEIEARPIPDTLVPPEEAVTSVENLSSALVESTVRAVGLIEKQRENQEALSSKVQVLPQKNPPIGNIMSSKKVYFTYMVEALLTFVDKIVDLAGREWADDHRIKTLRHYLHELEKSAAQA